MEMQVLLVVGKVWHHREWLELYQAKKTKLLGVQERQILMGLLEGGGIGNDMQVVWGMYYSSNGMEGHELLQGFNFQGAKRKWKRRDKLDGMMCNFVDLWFGGR